MSFITYKAKWETLAYVHDQSQASCYSLAMSRPWGTLFKERAQQALPLPAARRVTANPTEPAGGAWRRWASDLLPAGGHRLSPAPLPRWGTQELSSTHILCGQADLKVGRRGILHSPTQLFLSSSLIRGLSPPLLGKGVGRVERGWVLPFLCSVILGLERSFPYCNTEELLAPSPTLSSSPNQNALV